MKTLLKGVISVLIILGIVKTFKTTISLTKPAIIMNKLKVVS